jgi:uncharacterized protein
MIIADTGFFLALANPGDRYYKKAATVLAGIQEPLITTWPVMTETCHLLLHRVSSRSQLVFMEGFLKGAFRVFTFPEEAYSRLLSLMQKYQDLPMDLADASLVVLAEHLNHGKILSTDTRDFRTYRWKNHTPFENLLG